MTTDKLLKAPPDMNDLIADTKLWAIGKGIYEYSNYIKQFEKFEEEVGELKHEIELLKTNHAEADKHKIASEAGDVIVTLINTLHFLDLDLPDCLQIAYDKISKRTGNMIDGKFVKVKLVGDE